MRRESLVERFDGLVKKSPGWQSAGGKRMTLQLYVVRSDG